MNTTNTSTNTNTNTNTNTIIDYYKYVENLSKINNRGYSRVKLHADKAFTKSINYKRTLKEVLLVESYNFNGQNSLIVWDMLDDKSNLEEFDMIPVLNKIITDELTKKVILADDMLKRLEAPMEFEFESDKIKQNFIISRAIYFANLGYDFGDNKEDIIKMITNKIFGDILKIVRYLHARLNATAKSTARVNLRSFKNLTNAFDKSKTDSHNPLENLRETLQSLKMEYNMEVQKYENISL